ncbi:hypothetical protein FHETE_4155 [Fusarium heterosporum]|uniref:Uncharacterized protein n=1 Tax=Fusarium heterosporum TaxID=42747 RepID=A0A8H5TJP2_FUSHE|nr:hypothetical protein FHETE_4155 [Fusarium heterosporum]
MAEPPLFVEDDLRVDLAQGTVYVVINGREIPTYTLTPIGYLANVYREGSYPTSSATLRSASTPARTPTAPASPHASAPAPALVPAPAPAPALAPAPPELPRRSPSQRVMEARDIDVDRHVTQRRAANTRIYLHSMLSTEEKKQLFIIAGRVGFCNKPPSRLTVGDWERFLDHIFDGWNSAQSAPRDEKVPDRKFSHTHIPVGFLRSTLPFSDTQKRAKVTVQKPERVAGATVYFGLSLNFEADCIQWLWRDSTNSALSSKYVKLQDGYTHARIRAEAVANYDSHERQRVQQHNQKYVITCARRVIKKWAERDPDHLPVIDDTEFPHDIVPAVFANPIMANEVERWAAIADFAEPNFHGVNVLIR